MSASCRPTTGNSSADHAGASTRRLPLRRATLTGAAILLLAACTGPQLPAATSEPPATPSRSAGPRASSLSPSAATEVSTATSKFTVVAVGDISVPALRAQAKTARLAESWNPTYVLALGDLQYPSGTLTDFKRYYGPTWGQLKSRTMPVPGNHEYRDPNAAGYFQYFGSRATPKGLSYYSFNRGNWHFVALNSEIEHSTGSDQLKWLRADLEANKRTCVLAYWHKPRFNSGAEHGSNADMAPFWDVVYAGGGDVVLNGHEHVYERFGRQTPSASATRKGIREFIVGTGGAESYRFAQPVKNSQVRVAGVDGVLRLTLEKRSYRWAFVAVDGTIHDQGGSVCH